MLGRYSRPSGAVNTRPTVRSSTGTRGRSSASSRRRASRRPRLNQRTPHRARVLVRGSPDSPVCYSFQFWSSFWPGWSGWSGSGVVGGTVGVLRSGSRAPDWSRTRSGGPLSRRRVLGASRCRGGAVPGGGHAAARRGVEAHNDGEHQHEPAAGLPLARLGDRRCQSEREEREGPRDRAERDESDETKGGYQRQPESRGALERDEDVDVALRGTGGPACRCESAVCERRRSAAGAILKDGLDKVDTDEYGDEYDEDREDVAATGPKLMHRVHQERDGECCKHPGGLGHERRRSEQDQPCQAPQATEAAHDIAEHGDHIEHVEARFAGSKDQPGGSRLPQRCAAA